MRIFATGINGFIGSHLVEHALAHEDWTIVGADIDDGRVRGLVCDRFEFTRADVFSDDAAIEAMVERADCVLPLAGVARPAFYVAHPLKTFELDFEANLKIVRMCAAHGKRVIFPSTSEVYGMCGDSALHEDSSPLVTGPIRETRWIYSAGKQLMDRVIFAMKQELGLSFTLFRPFNWTGPRLDTFDAASRREARAITQMIYDVITRGHITLVGGGAAKRSFTWIGDGIDALARIINDRGERTDGGIYNIGAPTNNASIRELAELVIAAMASTPKFADAARRAELVSEDAAKYYGPAYADTRDRVPSVERIEEDLGWRPTTSLEEMVRLTVEYYASCDQA